MGKLTQNIPKPLVKINGKSIIERQLSILKQNGILDIIIITGPYHEKFNFEKIRYVRDENFLEHDQLGKIAKSANYRVFQVKTKNQLVKVFQKIKTIPGPIMVIVKIEKGEVTSKRINIEPTKIKNRFMNSLKK